MDSGGLWLWDSGRDSVTRVKGTPEVRFVRPADLLPTELGRRIAAAATGPIDLSPLPERRIAGIGAAGVRIEPVANQTTIDRVDMWVDPDTGLPVAVEVVAQGVDDPLVSTHFLDFEARPPAADTVRFVFPEGASFSFTTAADFAQAVDRYSPFVLPDEIGGLQRRSSVAGAAGTFGHGFELAAALALSERYSPFTAEELARVPTISGEWGAGNIIESPLFNALTFERGGVRFILGGTVTVERLEAAAAALVDNQFGAIQ